MLKNTFPYSNNRHVSHIRQLPHILKINLHTRLDDGKDPKSKIDDKTKDELKENIKNELKKDLKFEIGDKTKDELKEKIKNELEKDLKFEIDDKTKEEIKDEIKDEVDCKCDKDAIQKDIEGKIKENVKNELKKDLKCDKDAIQKDIEGKIKENVKNELKKDLKCEIDDKTKNELKKNIKSELEKDLKFEIGDKTKNELKEKIKNELEKDLKFEIGDKTKNELKEKIKNELEKDLKFEIDDKTKNELKEKIKNELEKDLKFEIDDKTKNEIKDKIKKEIEDEIDCKRDKNGHDKGDKDKDGFNKDGYDKDGYNREGFDKDGYDKGGYNREGFDKDGYNKKGFDKDGKKKGDDDDGNEVKETASIVSQEITQDHADATKCGSAANYYKNSGHVGRFGFSTSELLEAFYPEMYSNPKIAEHLKMGSKVFYGAVNYKFAFSEPFDYSWGNASNMWCKTCAGNPTEAACQLDEMKSFCYPAGYYANQGYNESFFAERTCPNLVKVSGAAIIKAKQVAPLILVDSSGGMIDKEGNNTQTAYASLQPYLKANGHIKDCAGDANCKSFAEIMKKVAWDTDKEVLLKTVFDDVQKANPYYYDNEDNSVSVGIDFM